MLSRIERHQILIEEEHGFRNKRSASANLMMFWDKITALANEAKEVSITYTDLRRVFDSVPLDLLSFKLHECEIEGKNYRWLQDFLRNRQQWVKIGNALSQLITVERTDFSLVFSIALSYLQQPKRYHYCNQARRFRFCLGGADAPPKQSQNFLTYFLSNF